MRKLATWLAGAALAAAAALGAASSADAGVVTFNEVASFGCDVNVTASHGGMTFGTNWYACTYAPGDSADFPTPISSTVFAVGFGDLLLTADDSSPFSLDSVDLAYGPFDHQGAASDTTTVTGFLAGGGTVSTVLDVRFGFQRFHFGPQWTNLASVNFGQLAQTSEYLAFDNIAYNGGVPPALDARVPEPATWGLMILGFAGAGAMLRNTRRKAALA